MSNERTMIVPADIVSVPEMHISVRELPGTTGQNMGLRYSVTPNSNTDLCIASPNSDLDFRLLKIVNRGDKCKQT
jgi:hypothetical protein